MMLNNNLYLKSINTYVVPLYQVLFFMFYLIYLRKSWDITVNNIGCSFKFILKVGVEESIVNAPFFRLQSKNANNAKSEVRFKQLIRDPQSVVRSQSILQRQLLRRNLLS
jgi:hypothetical protein